MGGAVVIGRRVGAVPATIGLLISFLVCWGLQHSWRNTLGYVLRWLGDVTIHAHVSRFGISIHPFGVAKRIDRDIYNWLADATALTERGFVYMLNVAVEPFLLVVGVLVAVGELIFESGAAFETYASHAIPRLIEATLVKPLERFSHFAVARIELRLRQIVNAARAVEAAVAHATRVAAHALEYPLPRIGRLEKRYKTLSDEYTRLRSRFAPIAFAGAVALALTHLGFGFLKCSGWQRVGRRMTCGMSRFFESLLALAVDTLVITHLCATTKLLTRLAHDVQPLLSQLTSGVEHLMECQGASRVPDLTLNAADLPVLEKSLIAL